MPILFGALCSAAFICSAAARVAHETVPTLNIAVRKSAKEVDFCDDLIEALPLLDQKSCASYPTKPTESGSSYTILCHGEGKKTCCTEIFGEIDLKSTNPVRKAAIIYNGVHVSQGI